MMIKKGRSTLFMPQEFGWNSLSLQYISASGRSSKKIGEIQERDNQLLCLALGHCGLCNNSKSLVYKYLGTLKELCLEN